MLNSSKSLSGNEIIFEKINFVGPKSISVRQLFVAIREAEKNKINPRLEKNNIPSVISPLNILVVEDNAVNTQVICAMLKKLGMSYKACENGVVALSHYKKYHQSINLVLMDCEIPVLDGFSCTKKYGSMRKIWSDCQARNCLDCTCTGRKQAALPR